MELRLLTIPGITILKRVCGSEFYLGRVQRRFLGCDPITGHYSKTGLCPAWPQSDRNSEMTSSARLNERIDLFSPTDTQLPDGPVTRPQPAIWTMPLFTVCFR